jgi:hypothetical protein
VSDEDPNVLHTMTLGGNVHESAQMINKRLPELIDHVVAIEFNGGLYSTVIFRAPASLIGKLKAAKRI